MTTILPVEVPSLIVLTICVAVCAFCYGYRRGGARLRKANKIGAKVFEECDKKENKYQVEIDTVEKETDQKLRRLRIEGRGATVHQIEQIFGDRQKAIENILKDKIFQKKGRNNETEPVV